MRELITCLIICVAFSSCADFIEYPLENKSVKLLAPGDSLISTNSFIQFWWDENEDAKFYRLQLVQPDFNKIEVLIKDTVISKNKLTLELADGTYTWRVSPENHGSIGEYSEERYLTVKKNEN